MPTEWQPASRDDGEQFPKLKADLGEDPARWLDTNLVEYGESHTDYTRRRMVQDRIAGIDNVAVCRAWIAIERRLDRGPREAVIGWLEERLDYLEEYGDQDDRRGRDRLSPEQLRERAEDLTTESVAEWPDRDGNQRSKVFRSKGRSAFATDGGESE